MIVIISKFAGILDDWLLSLGLSPATESKNQRAPAAISLSQWTEDVRAAVALAPGLARGLEIGARVQLRHTGPLGYLVVNSRTLSELLETYLLLEKWFYGQNWASTTIGESQFDIAWDQRVVVPDRLVEQLHAMAFLTVLRAACPAAGHPLRVEVMSSEEGETDAYERAFGCPVRFGRSALRLVFPTAALQAPVDIDSESFSYALQNRQRTLREAGPDATRFVLAVQEAIMHHLPAGAPTDSVAATLNLSRRTLQRRLTEVGCTYRQLLDGIRERHVRSLLEDKELSLGEVAFLLGYSEQSAFNHAYRRWNSVSPLQTHH